MGPSIHGQETKDLLIENMLKYVPQDGWSMEALRKAVVDTGFAPGDEQRAFHGSIDRAIEHYLRMMDRQLEEKLSSIDLSQMRIHDRVATGVMIRLRLAESHKEAVRKSLLYLSLPLRSAIAMKSLYHTVDTIWYAAGDRATDFNYYSKRFLLAGVYSATLIYWLEDASEDSLETRAYLERRLADVMMIPKIKSKIKEGFSLICQPFWKR